jgi:hypothetical protein
MVLSKFCESLLALNHLFKDSNSIFISFLKSSGLKLVSFANKIGLKFPVIALRKEKVGDLKLILVEHHVL